jgi:hypothetical protein
MRYRFGSASCVFEPILAFVFLSIRTLHPYCDGRTLGHWHPGTDMRYAICTSEQGTSLVEILVALTILSVSVLGLVGASAAVNRMLAWGRWTTVAMAYAERRLELLRAAAVDSTSCAGLGGGSASLPGGLTESWNVTSGSSVAAIQIVIAGNSRPDTLTTVLFCP